MSVADNYSRLDRLLHSIAFCHPFFQKILSELESGVFSSQLKNQPITQPVFITALPRAGTTLLLELIYGTGEFATFTYRQMPFVLAPLFWNMLSAPFQQKGDVQERAHGDGVEISLDSPEAFEEVLWINALGKKIIGQHVLYPVNTSDLSEDFRSAFLQTIQKLLLLKQGNDKSQTYRYLSKNNANISRLSAITTLFPDAIIIIPFRNPLIQVQSLMNQHERFLNEHEANSFSQKYMHWIGHYEFGANLRPIDFDGEYSSSFRKGPLDANFWIGYWSKAYKHCIAEAAPNVHFLDFDDLIQEGASALPRVGEKINISRMERLTRSVSTLRAPKSAPIAMGDIASDVRNEAQSIYEHLCDLRL